MSDTERDVLQMLRTELNIQLRDMAETYLDFMGRFSGLCLDEFRKLEPKPAAKVEVKAEVKAEELEPTQVTLKPEVKVQAANEVEHNKQ